MSAVLTKPDLDGRSGDCECPAEGSGAASIERSQAGEYEGSGVENKSNVGALAKGRTILAIDPGMTQSGWCLFDGDGVLNCGVFDNARMLELVQAGAAMNVILPPASALAIEMIASYGMAVGREVFETCVWIGRFKQAWHDPEAVQLVYRKDVKLHLCGSPRAKDPNVRQALIDLFPATGGGKVPQLGTKEKPGPLYGVSTHVWPALGVAVTVAAGAAGGK